LQAPVAAAARTNAIRAKRRERAMIKILNILVP
jgi:hypothetical protein